MNSTMTTARRVHLLATALCVLYGEVGASGQVAFTERATAAGVAMTNDPGPNYIIGIALQIAGGAVGDFNNDGYQDLFAINGGTLPDNLFINNGDGTFTDQAAAWGLTDVHMGAGAAVGDFNNDGWLDLYVTSYGDAASTIATGAHHLYRNNGNNTFTNIAVSAGVNYTNVVPDAFSAAFGDYDMDGDLDLFVTSWFTVGYGGNRLFRNNGDETFTDVTVAAGVFDVEVHGFSLRFTDMNRDRLPELLLAGDFGTARYYINNGDGTFADYTGASGTGLDCNAMGQTVGDFNNDGLLDWYITNIDNANAGDPNNACGNMLYINQGNHQYVEQASASGVIHGFWGWGTAAVDVDNDTLVDLVEVNGYDDDDLHNFWENKPARVFMNNGDLTFTDVAAASGFSHIGQGRGLVNFDFDNDGDQDFVVFSYNEPLEFYRNDSVNNNNWIRIFLDTSNAPELPPNGFGTHVQITVDGQTYHRFIDGGSNYLSQSELSAHFGVGTATVIDRLRIDWANGLVTQRYNVPVNQTLTIKARRAYQRGYEEPIP